VSVGRKVWEIIVSKIDFYKMVASGNDFVLIDRRKVNFSPDRKIIQQICSRKFGVGSDGLLLIENSRKADFRMRIFNPDGSEPTMCGNGARCAALYYFTISKKKEATVETGAGILNAQSISENRVKIRMTEPHSLETDVHLDVQGTRYIINFIDTGVPHAVIFSNDIDNIDLKKVGPLIRFHDDLAPEGANVNFVKVLDKNSIKIRTYERGVEDETLACGTGSVASAVVYGNETPEIDLSRTINVHTRSGEILKIYFKFKDNKFHDVWLEGQARFVFSGNLV
jgi:diaminopimelate epimerase